LNSPAEQENVTEITTLFPQAYRCACRTARSRYAAIRRDGLEDCDVQQEALLKVWMALPRFDPSRASLRTFIEKVVFHAVVSAVRRRRAPEALTLQLADLRPASSDPLDVRICVREVLSGVSAFDRVVALSLAEYSPTETGIRLGVGRATVYRTIGRLRTAFTGAGLSPSRRRDRSCDPLLECLRTIKS
jgi:RNA polymerase sigma factor (sigma-70 family)